MMDRISDFNWEMFLLSTDREVLLSEIIKFKKADIHKLTTLLLLLEEEVKELESELERVCKESEEYFIKALKNKKEV